ncbi:hypothetical protein AB5I41_10975 [Sphingomonas sp. MMS24-JH45]
MVVDGVALGNASQFPPPIFDAARVEVLNGPQGALLRAAPPPPACSASSPTHPIRPVRGDRARRRRDAQQLHRARHPEPAGRRQRGAAHDGDLQPGTETIYNHFDGSQLRNQTKGGRARSMGSDRAHHDQPDRRLWRQHAEGRRGLGADRHHGGQRAEQKRLAACGVQPRFRNQDACIDGGNATKIEAYRLLTQADMDFDGITLSSISAYRAGTQAGRLPIPTAARSTASTST